jgi:hypothetical protein
VTLLPLASRTEILDGVSEMVTYHQQRWSHIKDSKYQNDFSGSDAHHDDPIPPSHVSMAPRICTSVACGP